MSLRWAHMLFVGFVVLRLIYIPYVRQYNKCDPNDPMCAMMECGHSPTSLEERARELKLEDISKMIHAASNGKVTIGSYIVD